MVTPREVAVSIPVQLLDPSLPASISNIHIYLVSSRKHSGKYVLPKGGVESGESSRQAAVRELWEEAGLIGELTPSSSRSISLATPDQLTEDDHKPHKKSPASNPAEKGFVPRARYTGHEVLIKDIKQDWPESHERERKSFTVEQGEVELQWRKDIHSIFKTWASHIPTTT